MGIGYFKIGIKLEQYAPIFYLFVYLFTYLFIYLSIYLFVCLFIYLFCFVLFCFVLEVSMKDKLVTMN